MDRGAWPATVPGVAKSWTRLSNQTTVLSTKINLWWSGVIEMFPRCFSNKTGKWLPNHGCWMGVLLKWLTGRKFLEVLFYHIAFSTVQNRSVMSNSLRPHGLQPARLLCPWDSPGTNTGVGCHALLQGIFLTQELNPGLPHCRQTVWAAREAQLFYCHYTKRHFNIFN